MMTREMANEMAASILRDAPTPELVAAFEATDKLIEAGGMSSDDYMAVCDTRGWIMDALAERNCMFLIGMGGSVRRGYGAGRQDRTASGRRPTDGKD